MVHEKTPFGDLVLVNFSLPFEVFL
jgi:hypothetical protein